MFPIGTISIPHNSWEEGDEGDVESNDVDVTRRAGVSRS